MAGFWGVGSVREMSGSHLIKSSPEDVPGMGGRVGESLALEGNGKRTSVEDGSEGSLFVEAARPSLPHVTAFSPLGDMTSTSPRPDTHTHRATSQEPNLAALASGSGFRLVEQRSRGCSRFQSETSEGQNGGSHLRPENAQKAVGAGKSESKGTFCHDSCGFFQV